MLEEILESISNEYDNSLGEEAAQERKEDQDFVYSVLEDSLESVARTSVLLSMSDPDDTISVNLACYLGGACAYRKWLIERGVDVRALEGR